MEHRIPLSTAQRSSLAQGPMTHDEALSSVHSSLWINGQWDDGQWETCSTLQPFWGRSPLFGSLVIQLDEG